MMEVKLVRWHNSTFSRKSLITDYANHRWSAIFNCLSPGFDLFLARAYRLAKNQDSSHKTKILRFRLFVQRFLQAHIRGILIARILSQLLSANTYFSFPECEYVSKAAICARKQNSRSFPLHLRLFLGVLYKYIKVKVSFLETRIEIWYK